MIYPTRHLTPPPDNAIELQEALVKKIAPIFVGQHPAVIGAAIAELHAILLAGTTAMNYEPSDPILDDLLELHADTVRELLPGMVAHMHEHAEPNDWLKDLKQ